MAMDKQLIPLQNQLNRLEAKLDALLGDRKKDVKLPPEITASGMPYPIRGMEPRPELSTITPPTAQTNTDPRTQVTTSTIPLPERTPEPKQEAEQGKQREVSERAQASRPMGIPTAAELPIPNYDKLTVGEIMKELKAMNPTEEQRNILLRYERANKNREQVVTALVNWNS